MADRQHVGRFDVALPAVVVGMVARRHRHVRAVRADAVVGGRGPAAQIDRRRAGLVVATAVAVGAVGAPVTLKEPAYMTEALTPGEPIKKDLVIIGGGPVGLTAAIYAVRSGLTTIVFSRKKSRWEARSRSRPWSRTTLAICGSAARAWWILWLSRLRSIPISTSARS